MSSTDKITLYNFDPCPFGHRVLATLKECDVDYDYKVVDLQNIPEWYKEINPDQKIPVIQTQGQIIPESLVIIEYLSDLHPEKNLMPKEPIQRAQVRFAIEYFSKINSELYKCITNFQDKEIRSAYESNMNTLLKRFDEILQQASTDGPYFMGEMFTLADIAMAPFILRMNGFHKICLNNLTLDLSPRVSAFFDAVSKRPCIQETYYGDRPYFDLLNNHFHFF